MTNKQTVSSYLIQQLYNHGIHHVFGVPGDYTLGFFHELEYSKLQVINTCDEQGAGFAADAYARIRGLGVVCVTYCVGGLKIANTTAQAFAEKSPVVVISGAPGTTERIKYPLLHHKVRNFDTQLKVFEQITAASAVIDNPQTACREINRVLDVALRFKQPVYIELPRDMISAPVVKENIPSELPQQSDQNALAEALQETKSLIHAAKKPVIIAGVELHRFGLQKALLKFIDKTQIPVASTVLGKSVIHEQHPRYLGVYEGSMCRDEVREYVETSDCLILLGTFMSDVNLGIFTAHLDQGRSIYVTSEKICIRYHTYENVRMEDFIYGLLQTELPCQKTIEIPKLSSPKLISPVTGKAITIGYLFQQLNVFLDNTTVVIADTGDSLFSSLDMRMTEQTNFLASAYYASMGFAVPAGIGVQSADPGLRPLILVGDGAFQMTGMELSTIVKYRLNPIIIVLNNQGYATERAILDGKFNDILMWKYSKIPEILGSGKGIDVKTEDQLDEALQIARDCKDSFCILDVHIDPEDRSLALQRLTEILGKRVKTQYTG